MSNYNGEPLADGERRRISRRIVKGGGGFVCVHAADNAFPDWPAYNRIIGLGGWYGRTKNRVRTCTSTRSGPVQRGRAPGDGGHHGQQHDFKFARATPKHPIMQGLPRRVDAHQGRTLR